MNRPTRRDILPLTLAALALASIATYVVLERRVSSATASLSHAITPTLPLGAGTVPALSLSASLKETHPPLVIDTRPAADFAAGHISGSINLTATSFETEKGKFFITQTTTPVVLVCATETLCSDAQVIFDDLDALGYKQVSFLSGGMQAWTDASFPTTTVSVNPADFIDVVGTQLSVPQMTREDATRRSDLTWIVLMPYDGHLGSAPTDAIQLELSQLTSAITDQRFAHATSIVVVATNPNAAKIAAVRLHDALGISTAILQ